ncbi:MAG TPA: hypothetical protein VL359_19240, partial [bacterium]|nr:hypothetical protein [bacterium]
MEIPFFRLPPWLWLAAAALGLLLSACATSQPSTPNRPVRAYSGYVKDSHPAMWRSNHAQVVRFRHYYARTRTVQES